MIVVVQNEVAKHTDDAARIAHTVIMSVSSYTMLPI